MTIKTFPLTSDITLVARVGRGSVRIRAVDDLTEARVTLTDTGDHEAAEHTTVELRGAVLQITGPRPPSLLDRFGGRSAEAIDYEIEVPSGTPLKVRSTAADVTVTGRTGSAEIAVGIGEFTAEHIDGDLRLRLGRRGCSVGRVSGSVHCRSGAGATRFGEVGGALDSTCGAGGLVVDVAYGAVRFRAGSGGASVGVGHADIDLGSGSGELRIGLAAGVSAQVDLTTGAGRVNSELPVAAAPAGIGRGVTVRARTGSGDVHLYRAA